VPLRPWRCLILEQHPSICLDSAFLPRADKHPHLSITSYRRSAVCSFMAAAAMCIEEGGGGAYTRGAAAATGGAPDRAERFKSTPSAAAPVHGTQRRIACMEGWMEAEAWGNLGLGPPTAPPPPPSLPLGILAPTPQPAESGRRRR